MAEEKPFTQVLPKERCEIQEIKDVTEACFKKSAKNKPKSELLLILLKNVFKIK